MGIKRWEMVSPTVAPSATITSQGNGDWSRFDNSVNAVSFGFVATAILISLFLVMAIFERFLWPRSLDDGRRDGSAGQVFDGKPGFSSPKLTVSTRDISVLMPGEDVPTFIAHPAPPPCPIINQQTPLSNASSNSISSQR